MERNNFIFKLTKSVDEITISSYHYDFYKAVHEVIEFLGEVPEIRIDIEDALSEEDYKFEFKNGDKLAVISPCIIK